jgi:hypothetical protein
VCVCVCVCCVSVSERRIIKLMIKTHLRWNEHFSSTKIERCYLLASAHDVCVLDIDAPISVRHRGAY